MIDLPFIWTTFLELLAGLPLTLQLAAISVAAGSVLGGAIAACRTSGLRVLSLIAQSYVFIIRGTPLLVQIFIIYYGLGQFRPKLQEWGLWTFLREPYWCAILALALCNAAYCSEIIRGGLSAVPSGQREAGRACGMSGLLLFRRIVFPLALRSALPAYGNEIIIMVKATSLASVITLMEVSGIAGKIIAETFRPVEVFVAAGAIYLTLNFGLVCLIGAVEHVLWPHMRDGSPKKRIVSGEVHA